MSSSFVRMVGFFAAAWVLMILLRGLPVVGFLFRGFFSFWIVLILLSVALDRGSRALSLRRQLEREFRSLGNVESPHNQGKLGSLLLANGRKARALEHLERAAAGEPDVAEWQYRHGQALLATGRFDDAVVALERAVAIDEEHAYGGVQLALAESHQALDQPERALDRLTTFERNHGPSPECAYRRGLALRAKGQKDQARESFGQVSELVRAAPAYQRKEHSKWTWRATLAKLGAG